MVNALYFRHQVPKGILVSCKDRTVLHVEAPVPGKYDTSKTYHLPLRNVKIKEYHFTSVKDKLRVSVLVKDSDIKSSGAEEGVVRDHFLNSC